jgi:hypothetical protein
MGGNLGRGASFLASVIAVFLGIPGLIGVFLLRGESFLIGLGFFLVGFAPLAGLIWIRMSIKSRWERVFAGMLIDVGVPAGPYAHGEEQSGIAIHREKKTLTLLNEGTWHTYPYADVRNWERNSVTAGGGLLAPVTWHQLWKPVSLWQPLKLTPLLDQVFL